MAQFIVPDAIPAGCYRGIQRIFQFTNWDGSFVPYNCGQAAAATYLTFHGLLPSIEERAVEIMRRIEADYPPDIAGGWLGSSRRRIEQICRAGGLPLQGVHGEAGVRVQLSNSRPVLVMLQIPGAKLFSRWPLPTGHWMVAYGFDDQSVYLTNWGKMSWEIFRQRWNALVPRVIGMRNRFLAAVEPRGPAERA
jgi:hypothetical protein